MSSKPNTGKRDAQGWVGTPHGRFVYVNGSWENEFHMRASTPLSTGLGNTRVVLLEEKGDELRTLQQKTDYYPFGMVMNQTNPGTGPDNKLLYNGKEIQDDVIAARKLDWYDYGARFYDPQIGRWHSVDPLAEIYFFYSPYAFVSNNPIVNREIDGRYFEEGSSHERTANRIERRAERRADRLERTANRREERGRNVGDLRERAAELKQTAQDIRDMRADPNTLYRYANIGSQDSKKAELSLPETRPFGKNSQGHQIVYMFTGKTIESRIHESRHGGQIARGEMIASDKSTYNFPCEISGYRAQYSYRGIIRYPVFVNWEDIREARQGSIRTIKDINQINEGFLKNLVDYPGIEQRHIYRFYPTHFWQ